MSHRQPFVVAFLAAAAVLAGCARTPDLTRAAGSPSTTPPAAGTRAAQSGAGVVPAGLTGGAATGTGTSPAFPARPSPRDFEFVADLVDIHFDFDRYDVRTVDRKVLETTATWLKARPGQVLLIEGHTDERGTEEYNLALGERRAKSTMNYLVSQGVQADRINVVTYGEQRPTCPERNESCWAKNRRAHFMVKGR
jgi:peptidoglycan-associated lipoprotein